MDFRSLFLSNTLYTIPCYQAVAVIWLYLDQNSHANYLNDFCGLESLYRQHTHTRLPYGLKHSGCFLFHCHF